MYLVVGLGNPDKKYLNTFHNMGFMCVDKLAQKLGVTFDEGAVIDGDKGDYGPYYQSKRKDIYHVFAKTLVEMRKKERAWGS